LPGGLDFDQLIDDLSEEALAALPDVVEDLAKHLMLKSQHKYSIAGFNNHMELLREMEHLGQGYKDCLNRLAPDYNKALSLVQYGNNNVISARVHASGARVYGVTALPSPRALSRV
jgi:hypothetical protein